MTVDGHDISAIIAALDQAQSVKDRPTMIVARTLKGKGVSFLEDRDGWHGKPLKKGEELDKALSELPLNGSGSAVQIASPLWIPVSLSRQCLFCFPHRTINLERKSRRGQPMEPR